MPYLFQKRGIRVIYKGSIFVQKSIAVNPQRICKCHRYIVLNGVSVILIQNQCRGHNANLFCQFPCGETLECPVILQILARCGAFFIGFVVKGQMNHDFAFRIEVNPCVIEITIGEAKKYQLKRLHDASYGSILPVEDLYCGHYHNYSALYMELPFPPHRKGLHIQPKGTYLRAFCKGSWDKLPGRYMEILTYAEENHLQFYGFAYEKGINELVIDTLDDYITQIEIPIKT